MASENICMEIRISNCLPDTSTLIAHRLLTQNTSTTGLALFFQKSAPYASSHLSDSNPILPIFQAQTTNKNCNSYFHSMLNALMKPSDSDDWYRHDNCMFWVSPYYLTISSSTFKMHLESDHFSPPLPQSPWSEPLLSLIWITAFQPPNNGPYFHFSLPLTQLFSAQLPCLIRGISLLKTLQQLKRIPILILFKLYEPPCYSWNILNCTPSSEHLLSLCSLWNAPPQISTRLLSLAFSNHFSNLICSTRPIWSIFLIKKHAQLSQLHLTSSLGFSPVCVYVCVHTHARSVVSDALQFHALVPTRLLCPRGFSGKNSGGGCHFLFQGIFPTQGSNPHLLCLLYQQVDSLSRVPPGSPSTPLLCFMSFPKNLSLPNMPYKVLICDITSSSW